MMFSVFDRIPRRRCEPAGSAVRKGLGLSPTLEPLEARQLLSVDIAIDFSYDSNHLFDTPGKRSLIQSAANVLANGLGASHLSAIAPSGSDSWTASFPDPATGSIQTVPNLSVPADTIIVYVGGQPLPGNGEAGRGSTGGYSATGVQSWLDTVGGRGVAGALGSAPTRYAPWGGSIAFDTSSTSWYFGNSAAGLTPGQTDLFTVAEHELGHILGLGTSSSWYGHVSGDVFVGPAAMAVYGGPVPLGRDHAHWADHAQSDGVDGVMDPVLCGGSRSLFTDLDYAGLADVGWLVQRPSQVSTAEFGATGFGVREQGKFATITVLRTSGVDAFTVNYSTSDGTAHAGVDYLVTSGTVNFGIGETSETFTVPILDNAPPAGVKTLTLILSSPSLGATLGPQRTSVLSIVDTNVPTADDFDGDGRTDIGVFRPSTMQWFIRPSASLPRDPQIFGVGGLVDIPVPADYDRVGHAQFAVYRPSTAQWLISGHPQPFVFGTPNVDDIPAPADYLGLGYDQPALYRPSTGQWFIAGLEQPLSIGDPNPTDIPVPADYDGTGHAELAVFRPSTAQWIISGHPQPISFGGVNLLDIPVPGNYDSVGHAQIAVFRPSTAQWIISGHPQPISFGATNFFDVPLNASIGSLLRLGVIGNSSQTISTTAQRSLTASDFARTSSSTVAANLPVAPSPSPVAPDVHRVHRYHHHRTRGQAPAGIARHTRGS